VLKIFPSEFEPEFAALKDTIPPPLAVLELALLVYDSLFELAAVVPVFDLCLSGSNSKFKNLTDYYMLMRLTYFRLYIL
jgi:hypothetical protein